MPKGHKGFVKGRAKTGGRGKGVTNKVTADVRKTLQLLAEDMTPELKGWIQRTAKRNPEKATQLLLNALEFTQPKLQRTEMTGLDGAALSVELSSKDEKL